MAHNCPHCGCECDCGNVYRYGGEFPTINDDRCTHCDGIPFADVMEDDDEDPDDDDDEWNFFDELVDQWGHVG